MRVAIVEDSRLARAEMKRLLAVEPGIEIVAEAENADQAIPLLETHRPDLLLLDIDLPGRNGFDLLAALDSAPRVVFCTAYDQYAVRAFEQNALDYLVKPIEPMHLSRALDRARQALQSESLAKQAALGLNERVFVRDGERCWFVALKEIRIFEVDGNYTRLYFANERPLIPKSLNHLESRLDAQYFFRASRRQIVNLQWVSSVSPLMSGGLLLTLKTGDEVEVSRRQSALFRENLSL